jgi:hypothetical protein
MTTVQGFEVGRRVAVADTAENLASAYRRHLIGARGAVTADPGAGAADHGLVRVQLDSGEVRYFFTAELVAEPAPSDAELEREHHAAVRSPRCRRCSGQDGYRKCDRLAGHSGPCAQHQPSGRWVRWITELGIER